MPEKIPAISRPFPCLPSASTVNENLSPSTANANSLLATASLGQNANPYFNGYPQTGNPLRWA